MYFNRVDQKIILQENANSPKIEINGYEFSRTKNDVVLFKVTGRLAMLKEGGIIQLRENFKAVDYDSQERKDLVASSADVEFPPNELSENAKNLTIKSAKIFGNVNLSADDKIFQSEEIFYTGGSEPFLYSDVSSDVQQKNQFLNSEKGFRYTTTNKYLVLHGPVKGLLLPKMWNQNEPKKANTP